MPERVALLVGEGRFGVEPELHDSQGPGNDVRALGRLMGDPQVGNFAVREFLDATSYEVLDEVEKTLLDAGPDDTVLLYYSGQGIVDYDGEIFLATTDTKLASISTSSIPLPLLKSLLVRSPCRRVMLVVDCSYSGSGGGEFLSTMVAERFRTASAEAEGKAHIFASSNAIHTPAQREDDESGRPMGTFTRVLVEGIDSGAADLDGDHQISVQDLTEYLEWRMPNIGPSLYGSPKGAELRIAACLHPIPGLADRQATEIPPGVESGRRWPARGLAIGLAVCTTLGVALWSLFPGASPVPLVELGAENLATFDLDGAAIVRDLSVLREAAAKGAWIEHISDADAPLWQFPSAFTVMRAPDYRGEPWGIRLGRRGWTRLDFAAEVHALGFSCENGLNIATVRVCLDDGAEYSFDVATFFPHRGFFGFLSPIPIRRVRFQTESGALVVDRLYFYATAEYHRRVQ